MPEAHLRCAGCERDPALDFHGPLPHDRVHGQLLLGLGLPTNAREVQSNFLFQRKNMFTLIREIGLRGRLRKEAPYLVSAFLIDECFYKFHSSTLACGDFLATWFLFSAAALDHEADSASARWQILMRVPASKTRPITTETAI